MKFIITEITGSLIQQILSSLERGFQVDNFTSYESGYARETLRVETCSGEVFVVYLCTDTSDKYERRFSIEEKLVEMVNNRTDIPTQTIVKSDFSKNKIPCYFYIADEVEGYNPLSRYKFLPRNVKKNIAYQFGNYLAQLHKNLKFDSYGYFTLDNGEISVEKKTFSAYLEEWSSEKIEQLGETRFEDLKPIMKKFLNSNLELARGNYNCCVHWDNSPDNLIIKNKDINAVIDWEKSMCAPPEWDLALARNGLINRWFRSQEISDELEKELLDGYTSVRNLTGKWKEKILYFQTLHTLIVLNNFDPDFHHSKGFKPEQHFRQLLNRRYKSLAKIKDEEIKY